MTLFNKMGRIRFSKEVLPFVRPSQLKETLDAYKINKKWKYFLFLIFLHVYTRK